MAVRHQEIHVTEVRADDRDGIAALAEIRRAYDHELAPDDLPISVDELAAESFVETTELRFRCWLATVDGRPAAGLRAGLYADDANRHVAEVDEFYTLPEMRRGGVATRLLRAVVPVLRDEEGRSSFLVWTHVDTGADWAARLGLTKRMAERCSRMRIADLDPAQQQEWIDEGPSLAPGYRLEQLGDHCPEHLIAAYCEALDAMQDMPTDELDWTVIAHDEALVRSKEAKWRAGDDMVFRTLAVAPDGGGAGVSELFVSRSRRDVGHQGDTGVVAAHRGHRLGRWMKAVNLRTCLAEVPDVAVVETYNAQSNPWMLAINEAMGFRPHVVWQGWQGDIDGVIAALGA